MNFLSSHSYFPFDEIQFDAVDARQQAALAQKHTTRSDSSRCVRQ